jgi:RNA polymerase sigma factor (sigma-70 family)
MAKAVDHFLEHLRIVLDPLPQSKETDGELLARWAQERDCRAFAAVVSRHSAVVRRACRSVLRRPEDVEDTFQATFLVLARKAASLQRRSSLIGWLHQTALRLAHKSRTASARRLHREDQAARSPIFDPQEEISVREARAILAEELNRLPADCREPILLCLYEGLTQDEAARRLGCSLNTLKRRLERGRSLLSSRLTRRGLAPESTLALTLCLRSEVSARLIHETVTLAAQFTAGKAFTGRAVLLATGLLRTFMVKKVAVCCTLLVGLGIVAGTLRVPCIEPTADGKDRFTENGAHRTTSMLASLPARPDDLAVNNDTSKPRVDGSGDALPEGAIQRIGSTGLRHSGAVQSLLYTPDGKSIASLSRDGFLNLWDAATGRLRWRFADKNISYLSDMAVSADGQIIAALNYRNFIKVDANTGKQLIGCEVSTTNIEPGCQAIAPDLHTFACGLNDGTVRLYDATTGQDKNQVVVFKKVSGQVVKSVQFSGDGNKIYVMEEHGQQIMVFDAKTGNVEPSLPFWKEMKAPRLVMSPKHNLLAAIDFHSAQEQVVMWDLAAGKQRFFSARDNLQPRCSAFSPNNNLLAISAFGQGIMIYATVQDIEPRTLPIGAWPSSMAFSPDGCSIACGDDEGCITVWDVTTGKASKPSPEPKGLLSIRFVDGGREILCIGSEVDYWNAKSGELVRRITRQPQLLPFGFPIAVSDNGKLIAETNMEKIHISTASGNRLRILQDDLYVDRLVFSPDSTKLFSAGRTSGRVAIWDVSSGKLLHNLENNQRSDIMLVVSPNGRWLASAAHSDRLTKDSDINLWEIATGKLVYRLAPQSGGANAMCFSSDSFQLMCSFGEPTAGRSTKESVVKTWDTQTGKETHTFTFPPGHIGCIALHQNSRMFATGAGDPSHRGALINADKSVHLWEIASGKERFVFTGHDAAVFSMDFSADGALLAAASRDVPIYLWSVYGLQKSIEGNLTYDVRKQFWQQLADPDAGLAFKAICELIAHKNEAVTLLEEAWKGMPRATEKQTRQWVEALSSEQFAVRKSATDNLILSAVNHEDYLRQALQKANSLEARQRLENILGRIEPERLRHGRMLEVLEQLRTPEARRFLQTLAEQKEDTVLAREAAAGLKRLAAQR